MRSTTRFTLFFLALFLGLLPLSLARAAAPPQYTITDLGPTFAMAIDDSGMVAGSTFTPDQQAAILSPTAQAITTAGGRADAIQNGRVVGYAHFDTTGTPHAFVWSTQTGLHDLGQPSHFSAATDLNSLGLIVGYADDPTTHQSRPCLWMNGTQQMLPTLGGPGGFADAVNALGWIVGQTQTQAGTYHATLWIMGFPMDLDSASGTWSLARDISTLGHVVGDALIDGRMQGFHWRPGMGIVGLGVLPGYISSTATGVNAAGVIVGSSTGSGGFPPPQRAVRWVEGQIEELTPLVGDTAWVLEWASAINEAGAIVGQGHYQGQARSFLLTPQGPGVQNSAQLIRGWRGMLARERR